MAPAGEARERRSEDCAVRRGLRPADSRLPARPAGWLAPALLLLAAPGAPQTCTLVAETRVSVQGEAANGSSSLWTGNELAVVWGTAAGIHYQGFDEALAPLTPAVLVTTPGSTASAPTLAWSGSELLVACSDRRDGNLEIFVRRLARDGTPLGPETRVTNDPGASGGPEYVAAAWNGAGWGLLWRDVRATVPRIWFRPLDARAQPAGSEVAVSGGDSAQWVRLEWDAVSGRHVAAWLEDVGSRRDLLVTLLDRTGTALAPATRVTSTGNAGAVGLVLAPAGILLAYDDGATVQWDLFFARLDRDATIQVVTALTSGQPGFNAAVDTLDGGCIVARAVVSAPGSHDVVLQRLRTDGVALDEPSALGRPGPGATVADLDIAWTGSRALLTWRDDRTLPWGPLEVHATAVACDWLLRSTVASRLPDSPDARFVPTRPPWLDPDQPLAAPLVYYRHSRPDVLLRAVRRGSGLELWYGQGRHPTHCALPASSRGRNSRLHPPCHPLAEGSDDPTPLPRPFARAPASGGLALPGLARPCAAQLALTGFKSFDGCAFDPPRQDNQVHTNELTHLTVTIRHDGGLGAIDGALPVPPSRRPAVPAAVRHTRADRAH